MELEQSILIPAPPAAVYARLADASTWPEWQTDVANVVLERGAGSAVGDRFTQRVERGPISVDLEVRVRTADPPERLVHESENEQLTITTQHRLAPEGQGTRLVQHLDLELQSFALQLLSSRIRGAVEEKQRRDLEALAQLFR
jgi:carbon monoxide dehydrogenase subunit G